MNKKIMAIFAVVIMAAVLWRAAGCGGITQEQAIGIAEQTDQAKAFMETYGGRDNFKITAELWNPYEALNELAIGPNNTQYVPDLGDLKNYREWRVEFKATDHIRTYVHVFVNGTVKE